MMARRPPLALSLLAGALLAPWLSDTSAAGRQSEELVAVPGEILVEFASAAPSARSNARNGIGARTLQRFDALNVEHLRLPPTASPTAALRAIRGHPAVRHAQLNYVRRITASPNDPLWKSGALWGMSKIQADTAWTTFGPGTSTVVIMSIDTGVDYTHPDLAPNMWRNPLEVPGNGVDDDGNGYIDDVHGIDLANYDQDPWDDHGHGTHTMGTAAAAANNGIGVTGVAWNVQIAACKFLDWSGYGSDAAAAGCFDYILRLKFAGVNVRVSNSSWGSTRSGTPAIILKNAMDAAGNSGVLNVVSAGNDGRNNDVVPVDPASFDSPSIIAVGASNEVDGRWPLSNYGPSSVDLAAPGANIRSTERSHEGEYRTREGTSMAAPHVAGAAALLFAHQPSLTVAGARDALLRSVDVVPAWSGLVSSGGRLNVFKALLGLGENSPPTVSLSAPADGSRFNAPASITLAASASDADGTIRHVEFFADGAFIGRDAAAPFEFVWGDVPPGTYTIHAAALDDRNAESYSAPVRVTVVSVASTAFNGSPTSLPGTLQAENFDNGGQGIAYLDHSSGNEGGAYRATDVDVEPSTDPGGSFNVGWIGAGEWLKYTVSVAASGTYRLEFRVASEGPGGAFHVEVNGTDVTGPLAIPDTGGWQSWTTIVRNGVTLPAGLQVWRIVMSSNGAAGSVGNLDFIRVVTAASTSGTTPYPDVAPALPGIVQAENFDNGGAEIAYRDDSAGNAGGAYRATDVDLEWTNDTGGGYNVGWMQAREWLTYTINVTGAGTYDIEARVASNGPGGQFHIEVDGVDVTGPLTVPDTGGWQFWTTVRRSGVQLRAGQQAWRIVMDTNGASGSVGNLNFLRVVASPGGSTAYPGPAVSLPGVIEAENFDTGPAGVAYFDHSAGNEGGAYRATDVDVEPVNDAGGGYNVGWMSAGEWLSYSVNVGTAGTYTLEARVASQGTGGSFHVEVGGVDVTGPIWIPNTGSWQSWTTVSVPSVRLSAGPQVWRVVVDTNGESGAVGNLNYLRVR